MHILILAIALPVEKRRCRPCRMVGIEGHDLITRLTEIVRELHIPGIGGICRGACLVIDYPDSLTHYLKALTSLTTSATSSKVMAGPMGRLSSSSARRSVMGRRS